MNVKGEEERGIISIKQITYNFWVDIFISL